MLKIAPLKSLCRSKRKKLSEMGRSWIFLGGWIFLLRRRRTTEGREEYDNLCFEEEKQKEWFERWRSYESRIPNTSEVLFGRHSLSCLVFLLSFLSLTSPLCCSLVSDVFLVYIMNYVSLVHPLSFREGLFKQCLVMDFFIWP